MELLLTTKVRYRSNGKRMFAGPGIADVPKAVGEDLLKRGHATKPAAEKSKQPADTDNNPPPPQTFTPEQISEAILALDEDNQELWTDDGKPTVAAIEAELKGRISAEDRDAAWEAIQSQ